ncbi:hypothetical protein D3C86_1785600 [compost metagenome]
MHPGNGFLRIFLDLIRNGNVPGIVPVNGNDHDRFHHIFYLRIEWNVEFLQQLEVSCHYLFSINDSFQTVSGNFFHVFCPWNFAHFTRMLRNGFCNGMG